MSSAKLGKTQLLRCSNADSQVAYLVITTSLLGRNLLVLDFGAFSGHDDRSIER